MAEPSPKLRIRGVRKTYGPVVALDDTDLDLREGEFLTLLGPSGSGKTTLLMMVAGLTAPDRGEIWIDGKLASHLPVFHRDIGMVFQNYALFPHLTVFENIAFPLRMRRMPDAEIKRAVADALATVQLPGMAETASARALRRPAAAGRAGALLRLPAVDHPHGRAARRARQEAAGRDAARDQGAAFASSASRSSMSRTTRTRRWSCRTASA